MSWCRASPVLALVVAAACFPENPLPYDSASSGDATTSDPVTAGVTTGGEVAGLFGCPGGKCTLVLVSQTLDDRIDVFEVGGAKPSLRGRIALDFKPDASGLQTSGNLLDEPYGLVLTDSDLLVAIGHYPDTDSGSLLRFPRTTFADLEPGQLFATDRYFQAGTFKNGVEALAHGRREGLFLLPHPSGRVLVSVFANNLQTTQWTTPSQLLIVDPMDLAAGFASVDLGALPKPCLGAWELQALDPAVSKVALACDGSESIAVLSLPADFATAPLADVAQKVTGCGLNLASGWTTQFVSADGAGGFLAVQSQLAMPPKLWHVSANCGPSAVPSGEVPEALNQVHLLRQPVLLRPATDKPPLWLVAAGPTDNGVVIVQGGKAPTMCGKLTGLDALASENSPWALALSSDRTHLAIGAGPASNPQLSTGRGQVLWATLDPSGLDSCQLQASDVQDLGVGLFAPGIPATWMRAPNVVLIAELEGAS